MKLDFTYENPTKIYFGRTAMEGLKTELAKYGKTVMLAYGKGAIKKIGVYDQVMDICKSLGKTVVELSGVMPNPTYKKVMEGCRLVKENNVDLILAVDDGTATYCQDQVHIVFLDQPASFHHLLISRVGHNTGKFNDRLSQTLADIHDLVVNTYFLDSTFTIGEHNGFTIFGEFGLQTFHRCATKVYLGRILIREI